MSFTQRATLCGASRLPPRRVCRLANFGRIGLAGAARAAGAGDGRDGAGFFWRAPGRLPAGSHRAGGPRSVPGARGGAAPGPVAGRHRGHGHELARPRRRRGGRGRHRLAAPALVARACESRRRDGRRSVVGASGLVAANRLALHAVAPSGDRRNGLPIDAIEPTKRLVQTITFDNSLEFTHHRAIALATGARIHFADPYPSWQRGTNENCNGFVRQYSPKKSRFSHITDRHLLHSTATLNNRARKRLDYCTPFEALMPSAKRTGVTLAL